MVVVHVAVVTGVFLHETTMLVATMAAKKSREMRFIKNVFFGRDVREPVTCITQR